MKKFFFHFSILVFFFIIVNIISAFLWGPIKNINFLNYNKKDYYSKNILEAIGLKDSEKHLFYNEMWIERKFKYVQFAEHLESETKNQKYVNVTSEFGRLVENNINCNIRIFIYGSSQVFGYNVKDHQTIPSYFKKILDNKFNDKNFCVYNFGSADYHSTQENILFINHFLNQKILPNDYAVFIDGFSENGNVKSRIHEEIKYLFNGLELKVWDELKFSSIIFFNSLPVVKLYKHLYSRFSNHQTKDVSNDQEKMSEIDKKKIKEITKVFISNLEIRNAICKKVSINCYTFLPPIPSDSDKLTKRKYYLFKNIPHLIDISEILNEKNYLKFVDDVHYSPKAANFIANEIFNKINFD